MAWWAAIAKMAPQLMGAMGGGQGQNGKQGGGFMNTLNSAVQAPTKATMGIAQGALQQLQAMKLKKRADAALPPMVDPQQASFLAELEQKRKSIETGAAFQSGMNAIDASNAGTNAAIVRSTGGDAAGTIQALLQSQRVAADAKNSVIAQGQQQQMQYNSLYSNVLDAIAQRKLELQMYRSQQARAEWARKQQAASQNLNMGVASLLGDMKAAGSNTVVSQTSTIDTPKTADTTQTSTEPVQSESMPVKSITNIEKPINMELLGSIKK